MFERVDRREVHSVNAEVSANSSSVIELITLEGNEQLGLGFSWDYYYLTLSLLRRRCPHHLGSREYPGRKMLTSRGRAIFLEPAFKPNEPASGHINGSPSRPKSGHPTSPLTALYHYRITTQHITSPPPFYHSRSLSGQSLNTRQELSYSM